VSVGRPSRPPAWNLRPGEMGTLVLVGSSRKLEPLRRRLPSEWPTLRLDDPAQLDFSLAGASLVCIFASEVEGAEGKEKRLRVEKRAREARIPVVLFAAAVEPIGVLGLLDSRSVRLILRKEVGDRELARQLRETARRPVFDHVIEETQRRLSHHRHLTAALRHVIGQVPPSTPRAVERAARGEVVFVRTVKNTARLIGVSRSFLTKRARAAGLELRTVLKANTLLHGAAIFVPDASDRVSYRLGYQSPEGWRVLARRELKGEAEFSRDRRGRRVLERVASLPLGWFAEQLLRSLEGRR